MTELRRRLGDTPGGLMLTEFQQTKLAHRFGQLDADGDGQIQQHDLQTLAGRLSEHLVPAQRPALRGEIEQGYQALWKILLEGADTDGDGQVSLAEYVAAVEGGLLTSSEQYSASIERICNALFDALDMDGNGVLDPDELYRLGEPFGLTREETDAIFVRLDLDGSGEIDRSEWLSAVKDFYDGDDPESAGAVLFGRAL